MCTRAYISAAVRCAAPPRLVRAVRCGAVRRVTWADVQYLVAPRVDANKLPSVGVQWRSKDKQFKARVRWAPAFAGLWALALPSWGNRPLVQQASPAWGLICCGKCAVGR